MTIIEYKNVDRDNIPIMKEIKVAHGEKGHPNDYGNSNGRKCNIHGWHGTLYICEYYSRNLKNKLKKMAKNFRKGNFTLTITNYI